jgi:hypothetical protein
MKKFIVHRQCADDLDRFLRSDPTPKVSLKKYFIFHLIFSEQGFDCDRMGLMFCEKFEHQFDAGRRQKNPFS